MRGVRAPRQIVADAAPRRRFARRLPRRGCTFRSSPNRSARTVPSTRTRLPSSTTRTGWHASRAAACPVWNPRRDPGVREPRRVSVQSVRCRGRGDHDASKISPGSARRAAIEPSPRRLRGGGGGDRGDRGGRGAKPKGSRARAKERTTPTRTRRMWTATSTTARGTKRTRTRDGWEREHLRVYRAFLGCRVSAVAPRMGNGRGGIDCRVRSARGFRLRRRRWAVMPRTRRCTTSGRTGWRGTPRGC